MIYAFFFLKFRSQLRRTRPDIIRQFDESFNKAIVDAGGKITGDRFIISAVFNEEKIGFWLDIYILIETLKKNTDNSNEYFGYSLVISGKMPNYTEMLCRFLANYNGVFINKSEAIKFVPYATFEKPSEWLKDAGRRKYDCENFYKIKDLKTFKDIAKDDTKLQSEVTGIFKKNKNKNILIVSSAYFKIKSYFNDFYSDLYGDFPVLSIRFRSIGIGALVDSWSVDIRSAAGEYALTRNAGGLEEINKLWKFLFRERIRDEVSEYVIKCTKRFLILVFNYYYSTAKRKICPPVLVLENINTAGKIISNIIIEALDEFNRKNEKNMIVLGIGEDDILSDRMLQWESVFKNVIKIEDKNQRKLLFPRLSNELWEIVYAVSLFGRYFSAEFFQQLFEEDNTNPVMITRAFSILNNLGIIDSLREPRIVNRFYEEHSGNMINERTEKIKELVCDRLLFWAKKQSLNPCFRLLTIVANLDNAKKIDDVLLLKCFSSDVINDTIYGIETSIKNGQFEEITSERKEAIRYIYDTLWALNSGNAEDIEKIFHETSSESLLKDCDSFPVLKAQILVNLGAWYLGKHDIKEAALKTKEAIITGQGNNAFCLPQSYRIFALVCLLKKQPLETIEYLDFALLNADKAGNYHELAISTYYAAAAKFLYGDVFNAAKLIQKSIERALNCGRCEWADRSRFLEGRFEFDLGHYQKALEIFRMLQNEPYGSKTEEKIALLSAWIYRCNIYLRNRGTVKPANSCYDTDLFEIEDAYLSGDYKRTLDLANSLDNPFSNDNYLFTEKADWSSGFAQCEHLYFTNGEIQDRMINLFRSLALCSISPDGIEEAKSLIQKILRDEKLCEIDPSDAFYFFGKYLVLVKAGAEMVDMSTAVSMAFKRLQRRAGRIEDIETCRQYLNNPYWNRELSKAAKEFKLI